MTRKQLQSSIQTLTKIVSLKTGIEDIHIELCSDGFLVDHIGKKNEKVLDYFKTCNLTDFEYDAECDCSYYSYSR